MNKSVCIQRAKRGLLLLWDDEFRDDQTDTDSWHIVCMLPQCVTAVKGIDVQLVVSLVILYQY